MIGMQILTNIAQGHPKFVKEVNVSYCLVFCLVAVVLLFSCAVFWVEIRKGKFIHVWFTPVKIFLVYYDSNSVLEDFLILII